MIFSSSTDNYKHTKIQKYERIGESLNIEGESEKIDRS